MKRFRCPSCQAEVYFENSHCVHCGNTLGYLPDAFSMGTLINGGELQLEDGHYAKFGKYKLCQNAQSKACNWVVPTDSTAAFCKACSHNRTIPDLEHDDNLSNWQNLELAKRQLFYSLMRWGLPLATKSEDPDAGLAFDFLADDALPTGEAERVLTGHDRGLITLNIEEGDDATREKNRSAMGEPYRTLIGHFRHEIGHYYWEVLVATSPNLEAFRRLFGDERQDYGQALKHHYEQGAPTDWPEHYISSYASAHPWEDFAETWAHYMHVVDGLETAHAYGMQLHAEVGDKEHQDIDFRPYEPARFEDLINAWVPLTVALNSLNRSMGQQDFYPFVMSPPMLDKLRFVHDLVHREQNLAPRSS